MNQDKLREQVKIAKALNNDWTYKVMSEVIDVSTHSFYNWLGGAFQLSQSKADMLKKVIDDLLD